MPTRLDLLRQALRQARTEDAVPEQLVARAIALRRRMPAEEVFYLRAAADGEAARAVSCVSASGLWTLDVFTARSGDEPKAGQVLLSVDKDHRASYEGLSCRVFVNLPEGRRIVAEAIVTNGEMFAEAALDNLDLSRSDALNVVFSPVGAP